MTEDRDHHADRGDHEDEAERHPAVSAADKLRACLGRDHAVDREPADREKEGEARAHVGTAEAEDPPCVDDLRLARPRTGVAEQPEDHRRGDGSEGGGEEAVPDPEPVIGGQEARGEEARVVDEGTGPQEGQLARHAVSLGRGDRIDAAALDPAERIRIARANGDVAHVSPSAGITQFRFMRSASMRPLSPTF